jgi:hypothetical protein
MHVCSSLEYLRLGVRKYEVEGHKLFVEAEVHNNIIMVEHAIVDQNMRKYNFFIYVDADFSFIYEPICIPLILYNILSLFIIDFLVTTLDTTITFFQHATTNPLEGKQHIS